ncbi:hypothetical protein DUI87_34620 [Hirundo rustica rustica]|uniref:HSF-type DNA-binding domain-containing protein n=1 Tax=Hirundo rustica rustica TaxID=333673 RepID=A0A3M0IHK0_HIRRU|nr:hypothetical protein DUI87_34620 [Hirundo rustica rustica]
MDAMAQLPLPAGLGAGTFPAKLWSLVNDPRIRSLRWDSEARELLRPGGAQGPAPHAFRATQFRGFVRQLYRYGFRKAHANRLSQPPLPLLFQPLAHKLQVHLLPGPPAQPQARAGPLPDTSAVAAMLAAPRRLKLQEPLHTAPEDAQPATPGLSVQGRGLHSIILLPPSQLGLGVSSRCCQSSWGWARSGTAPTFPSLGHHPAGSSKVPLCDITVLAAPTFHALETLQGKRPEPHPVIKLTRH